MKIKIGSFQWSSRADSKRLVALMLVALVALVAGVLLLVNIVRMPAPQPNRSQSATTASLVLARPGAGQHDTILHEDAAPLHPTPLFLPTRYNASQIDDATIARHEPGESLPLIEPRYHFSATTFAITFPDPFPSPAQPADVLAYGRTPTPYAQFGRADHAEKPLVARLAQLEVVDTKTGHALLTLPLEQPPATTALPAALAAANWSPLEFLVALDDAGLVGFPTLMPNPERPAPDAEVEKFFANYIVQTLRIGQRPELGAGLYILRIGP